MNNRKKINMRKLIIGLFLVSIMAASCSRSITPAEAASGKYKNCHSVR
jgi:hypothetical protein